MTARAIHALMIKGSMQPGTLAARSGISTTRLNRIMKGKSAPTDQELMDLAFALSVPVVMLKGFHCYRDDERFEEVDTVIGYCRENHVWDLVVSGPGMKPRRYPVGDMARDVFEDSREEPDAFMSIQTLSNRMLLIANRPDVEVEFYPAGERDDVPVEVPAHPIALMDGIKDIALGLESEVEYSGRYVEALESTLAMVPAGTDLVLTFLSETVFRSDGSQEDLGIDERYGDFADHVMGLTKTDPLIFKFDDGFGELHVDIRNALVIDLPLEEYLQMCLEEATSDEDDDVPSPSDHIVLIGASSRFGVEMHKVLRSSGVLPLIVDGPEYPTLQSDWDELAQVSSGLVVMPGSAMAKASMIEMLNAFAARNLPVWYFALDERDEVIDHVKTLQTKWFVCLRGVAGQKQSTMATPKQFARTVLSFFDGELPPGKVLHVKTSKR